MRTLLEAVREGDPGVIVGLTLLGLALAGAVWLRWAGRPVKPRNQAYTVANIQARLEREQAAFQAQIDQARRTEFRQAALADAVAHAAEADRLLDEAADAGPWPGPDALAKAENAVETAAVLPALPRPRRSRPYRQALGLRLPAEPGGHAGRRRLSIPDRRRVTSGS